MESTSAISGISIDKESPYQIFDDKKLMGHLSSLSPSDYTLLAVNQKSQRVLFQIRENWLVVYAYTSHVPHELSSYYFQGSASVGIDDARQLFSSSYHFDEADIMLDDPFGILG